MKRLTPAIIALTVGLATGYAAAADTPRPNVIFILADDKY